MNALIYILFFISGACGLVYEVVWSRMLTLIFGRSVLSVGIVLAAFMSGIALGSYVLGKLADRSRNPLRLYALYEASAGLSAFVASFLLTRTAPLHLWIHDTFGDLPVLHTAFRFLVVFAILIVPTTLMGATLPILSRLLVRKMDRIGDQLGRLYAINTVGAVAGSCLAGFYLIARLGLHGTIDVAVLGNLAVGAAAWFASARQNGLTSTPASTKPVSSKAASGRSRILTVMLWAFALSGMTSFAYEIFWTRSLVFLLGNTTYAFTLMLMAFLSGIALGGFGIRFAADRVKHPARLFAAIEIMIGIFSAGALPLLFFLVRSDAVHSFIIAYSGSLELLAAANFIIALSLMLLPAILIGATLPLMGKVFISDLKSTGATVGKIYAANTIGNVAGALLPGLLIMPLIGIQKGILLMAAVNLGIGAVLLASGRKQLPALVSAVVVLFAGFAALLSFIPAGFEFPSEYERPRDEVLYYREGGLATTKVWTSADTGYRVISVDGINIGGTSDSDYKQQILAHLPKLLLKKYESELSIGLGSGILAGESGRHAGLRKIVCVEIVKGVVEGAGYFRAENYDIVNDPRVTIVTDDVADFLQTSRDRYDIISADEKTTGKYASNAFSYSTEYYGLLRQHLAPGGLVIQWMPADLPPSQSALALRTFFTAFPHAQLWHFPPVGRFPMTNTFLIGSNESIDIDADQMRRRLEADPDSFQGIRKYGLTTADSLLVHYVGNETTIRAALPSGPLNSFDEPYYEFYSPADYAVLPEVRALQNHEFLMSVRGTDFGRTVLNGRSAQEARRLQAEYSAETLFDNGRREQLAGMPDAAVLDDYVSALRTWPENRNLHNEIISFFYRGYDAANSRGDYFGALEHLHKAADLYPESSEVHCDYGWMLGKMGRTQEAIQEMERSLAINPRSIPAHRILANLYALDGQTAKAGEQWQTAFSLDSNDVLTLVGYGIFLAGRRPGPEAQAYAQKAYRLDPEDPEVIDGYARVEYLSGNIEKARRIVRKGGSYFAGNPFFERLRTAVLNGT